MLDSLGLVKLGDLAGQCEWKRRVFNEEWRRGSLGWLTPAEAMAEAQKGGPVVLDRDALREEVAERTARLQETEEARGWYTGKAERRAIEAALETRDLLRRLPGGWDVG